MAWIVGIPPTKKPKSGKIGCICMAWIVGIPPDQRPLKREDFDKLLKFM